MWGPPSAARARGSCADRNPSWQLFTPAWHVPLWSDGALSFKVPSAHAFPHKPAAKYPFGGWHHANDHGWLFKRLSPRFIDGIYREAGSFLTTPFTEGCDGVNHQTLELMTKPRPLAVIRNRRQQRCTFSPTAFSSVQFSSVRPSWFHELSLVVFVCLYYLGPP